MKALKIIGGILLVLLVLGASIVWSESSEYPTAPREPHYFGSVAPFKSAVARRDAKRTVVLLVFDGLAPSVVAANATPNLDRMADEGASTRSLRPVFPTLSMPNHYSLSTGCLPEHHGIVSNRFVDPKRGLFHNAGDADWLTGCELLHVTAEKQGIRSAVFAWAGAASTKRGALATEVETYSDPLPGPREQVAKAIKLLSRTDRERPQYIAVYSNEPDQTEHFKGLDASETRKMVEEVDAAVGDLLKAIEQKGLTDQVAVIVTTDHGMIPADKHVNVEALLHRHDLEGQIAADGTIVHLYLDHAGGKERARETLSAYKQYFDVIDPIAQPGYSHLGKGPRIGDLMLSLKPPYLAFDRGFWPSYVRWAAVYGRDDLLPDSPLRAMHGYPPETPGVQALLFAWGSGIAQHASLDGMRSIDLHPTVARLLGIDPASPIDGRAFSAMFAPEKLEQSVSDAGVASDAGVPH